MPTLSMAAPPVSVLFVGNSFTFGRVPPVLNYNAANVHDMTATFNAISPKGTDSYPPGTVGFGTYEPHPWGGVPGIFKKMTTECHLDYDVSLSTRRAASLRGHYLNVANKHWNMRGNIASRTWNIVVLQERSADPLPVGKGKHANPAVFDAYADKLENFIHDGAAQSFTETQLYGSQAACEATDQPARECGVVHHIPANPHANPKTKIFLEETWARPNMVESHLDAPPDRRSPIGAPVVKKTVSHPDGIPAKTYYDSLAAMTADLHAAYYGLAARNHGFAGVVPVGDAFQLAVNKGVAPSRGFYGADGVHQEPGGGTIDLWWQDRMHASKYGSYLSALVIFGTLTGIDPSSLGAHEQAAADLGISPDDALKLQHIASEQLQAAHIPLKRVSLQIAKGKTLDGKGSS